METLNKILGWVLVLLAIAAVIALVVFTFFLDSIVKKGIVTVGPKVTQTTVELDAVRISILTGSATIQGLVVGNPEGYKTKQAISVGTAAIGLDPTSLIRNKIVIHSFTLESPDITFEGDPLTGNNLSRIRSNIMDVQKSGGPAGSSTNKIATAPNKPGKRLEVDNVVIKNAKVHMNITGMSTETVVNIPNIQLKDLGTDKNGITATDLSYRILDAITSATIKAAATAATENGTINKNIQKIDKGINNLMGK